VFSFFLLAFSMEISRVRHHINHHAAFVLPQQHQPAITSAMAEN
jgi:hypothetical protein